MSRREIQFKYYFQHNETGAIVSPTFALSEIALGSVKNWMDRNPRYYFIGVGQFTGLRDKNGREIYEGDICNDLAGFRFVVIWDEDNARFLGRGIGARKEYIRYVGQEPAVIVIGNIYDNPGLLGGADE